MAYINCPKCGNRIADSFAKCIYCNTNIYNYKPKEEKPEKADILVAICTIIASLVFIKTGFAINIVCIFMYRKHKTIKTIHTIILLVKLILILLLWLSLIGVIELSFLLPMHFMYEMLEYLR